MTTLRLRLTVQPAAPGEVRVRLVGAERDAEGERRYTYGALTMPREHWDTVLRALQTGAAFEPMQILLHTGEPE